jgi:hypothetical protein
MLSLLLPLLIEISSMIYSFKDLPEETRDYLISYLIDSFILPEELFIDYLMDYLIDSLIDYLMALDSPAMDSLMTDS